MLFSAKNNSVYHSKFYPRNDYYVIDSNEPVLEFINIQSNSELNSQYEFLNYIHIMHHIYFCPFFRFPNIAAFSSLPKSAVLGGGGG